MSKCHNISSTVASFLMSGAGKLRACENSN